MTILINKYSKIPKSTALKEYKLSEKDLSSIPFETAPNPHYRSSSLMSLYLVAKVSQEKWGSIYNFSLNKIKQQHLSEKRKVTRLTRQDLRRKKLIDQLEKRGLTLRSDSRLCSQYSRNLDLDKIVDIMEEMNFYHNHTNYRIIYDDIVEEELKFIDRFCKDEVSEQAKLLALNDFKKNNKNNQNLLPTSLKKYFSELEI